MPSCLAFSPDLAKAQDGGRVNLRAPERLVFG